MTKVRFSFVDVQGNPLPNMEFKLLLRRASFNAEDAGVVLPEELNVVTDIDGKVIVDLWPLKTAYRIQVPAEYEDLCGKLNWSFYVPVTDEIIEAQTLFLVPPPNNLPWDEEAMGKITQAVQDTQDSADSAKSSAVVAVDSANSAHTSASQAKASENAAAGSAASALTSKNAAAASQTSASQSAAAALTSKNDAAASAATSAAEAHQSNLNKIAAAASATDALASKNAAASSAADALASKNAAATSASQAAGSATAATNKAAEASTSAGTATTQAGVAKTEADRARAAANEASNKQPLNPKLTSLSGLPGGADRLVYFTGPDSMSQIGFGAAGRTLVSQGSYPEMRTTLGLGDAALAKVTTSRLDTTPGRLIKVGDFGGSGGNSIVMSSTADANDLTIAGNYIFPNGGLNIPAKVPFPHITVLSVGTGYSTQIAYSSTTPAQAIRVQSAGVFGPWQPYYTAANTVGSVADGGIVESGKSANGTYTKMADGTMEASLVISMPNVTTSVAFGPLFYSNEQVPETYYAAAFISPPEIGVFVTSVNYGGVYTGATARGTAIASPRLVLISPKSIASDCIIEITARGRWKN